MKKYQNTSRENKAPRDVKTRVLNTATKLFADRGILGVSLREIMTAADVNIASAHYYFGSKDKLYEACVLRFFPEVDKERRDRLSDILSNEELDDKDRLREILRAYVVPHYRLLEDEHGSNYVRMIGRFQAEPPEMTKALLQEYFGSTRQRYIASLRGLFPTVENDDLLRAFSFFVDYMLNAPSDLGYETLSGNTANPQAYGHLVDLVVAFGIGGFQKITCSAVS